MGEQWAKAALGNDIGENRLPCRELLVQTLKGGRSRNEAISYTCMRCLDSCHRPVHLQPTTCTGAVPQQFQAKMEEFCSWSLQCLTSVDLVPLSQGCHREPCCDPWVAINKKKPTAKLMPGSIALISHIPTGPEVAIRVAASNGLENMSRWGKFTLI